MKFIHKHIKIIYPLGLIAIVLSSYIHGRISDWNNPMAQFLPLTTLLIGAMAGPLGSLIGGVTGTLILYLVF